MLGNQYFYNKNLKKIVAVFGTLFNNISVAKVISGKMQGITRVPLSYAPRQKFLARLASFDPNNPIDVAVRMPRMSFEMTSIAYDASAKLNRLNSTLYPISENSIEKYKVYQSTPYIIGMQLNILARHQDDALQILEQILPFFNPEYTLSVKDLEGPGSLTDVPISLQSVGFSDDYEGDFQSSRRTIIYTLDFNIKVKFSGPQDARAKIIKSVDAYLYDNMNIGVSTPSDKVHVELGDMENDTPDDYTVITTFGFDDLEFLPPLSSTLSGLIWQVDRNIGDGISYSSSSGPSINLSAPSTLTDTTELTISTRYFNSTEYTDPDAIVGLNDEVNIQIGWETTPAYNGNPGYASSENHTYIKMYANDVLLFSSEDGQNIKSPISKTITIPPNQDVIISYRILMTPGASFDVTPVLSYV